MHESSPSKNTDPRSENAFEDPSIEFTSSPETVSNSASNMEEAAGGYFNLRETGPQSSSSLSEAAPLKMSSIPSPSAAALTALQYLPVPVLVLTAEKTVIVGNEAVGRLLGINPQDTNRDSTMQLSVSEILRGRPIGQLGIDILQEGSPIRMDWEDFLDNLVEGGTRPAAQNFGQEEIESLSSAESTPTDFTDNSRRISSIEPERLPRLSSANLASTAVLNASVDVTISQRGGSIARTDQITAKDQSSNVPLQATMIASIWTLEDIRYFTLTFTSAALRPTVATSRPLSRTAIRSNTSVGHPLTSSSSSSSPRQSFVVASTSGTTPSVTSALFQPPNFSPSGPPTRGLGSSTHSMFQKATQTKDAILNSNLPEARQSAKNTREQMRRVIEHAHITLWAVNKELKLTVLEGSLAWRNVSDLPGEEMLGRDIVELFGPKNPMVEPAKKILNGHSKQELVESHDDEKLRWFRSRLLPLYSTSRTSEIEEEANVDGVIGVSIDVTELRRREKELRDQQEENSNLMARAVAAKEASKMKSQFLANMSHEIRTPIAGVIGMTELLLDTSLDMEQKECAENIHRSANALLTVINDILDISKVESGRLDIEDVQFSLSVVIRDVNKMLSFAAQRKNLAYESVIQPEVERDFKVMGDPGRVRQILTNLITNSIKFTTKGFVKLRISIIGETPEVINVQFEVEDSGIGIESDILKRLFTPFSQADTSTARRFGGTGLGLTISKNLVTLMKGRIELKSQLGSGTTATFSIPFNKVAAQDEGSPLVEISTLPDRLQSEVSVSRSSADDDRTPPMTPQTHPQHDGIRPPSAHGVLTDPAGLSAEERRRVHVLVVEDNQINQQIALKTIKKLGFSVNAVWNGQEALDYLLQTPSSERPRPDIILMVCTVLRAYSLARPARFPS